MILVEQQIIKPFDQRYKPLIEMCHWSKDLYNAALYNIRQHYFETKNDTSVKYKFLSSIENWKILKNQEVFKKLQSNCAKSILRQVDSTFKSFFSLLHKKNKGEYIGQVKIPSYKDKRGINILVYQGCDFYQKWVSRGLLKIPKTNIFIKTKQKNIIQVRIIPKGNHLVAEVLYEKKEALVR